VRTAIISDIHGNLGGLVAVLADAESCACERIICLGDLIDGGPENAAVVEMIRTREIATVRGNHDFGEHFGLAEDLCAYLKELPEVIADPPSTVYTHISPRRRQKKVRDEFEAWNIFDECPQRLTFVGHVHVPAVYGNDTDLPTTSVQHYRYGSGPIRLKSEHRYVICVGAVGYPRDHVQRPRYGIYDSRDDCIEIRSVDGPVLDLG
jgi:predicted phosphodiesterase